MAWSTRELARLAGTTVNAIRYYHRVQLLDEPDRRRNGYKQYGVADLIQLLRLRRLVDLGISLSRIREIRDGGEHSPTVLAELESELASSIDRLQQAQDDVRAIMTNSSPAHVPSGFQSIASRLSEADNAIILIYTQLYDEDVMADVQRMAADYARELSADVNSLTSDADEETRGAVAERLSWVVEKHLIDYPWWMNDPIGHLSPTASQKNYVEAMAELYNPAQRDVIARSGALARERIRNRTASDGADGQPDVALPT